MAIEKNDALKSNILSTKLRLREQILNFSAPDNDIIMIRQELKNYCEQLNILEQKQSIARVTIFKKNNSNNIHYSYKCFTYYII